MRYAPPTSYTVRVDVDVDVRVRTARTKQRNGGTPTFSTLFAELFAVAP